MDDSEEIVEGSSQGQSMHPSAVRTGRPGRGLPVTAPFPQSHSPVRSQAEGAGETDRRTGV